MWKFFVFFPPTQPWVQLPIMPTMINTMALVLMVVHFLRDSLASTPAHEDYRTDRFIAIENICMCAHAVLDRIGISMQVHSLHTLWAACSKALAVLEAELFPGTAITIPDAIDAPAIPRKLTTLGQQAWIQYRPLIDPAHRGLDTFRTWFCTTYDPVVHADIFDILNDALLLLDAIGDICATPVQAPVFIGRLPQGPSAASG